MQYKLCTMFQENNQNPYTRFIFPNTPKSSLQKLCARFLNDFGPIVAETYPQPVQVELFEHNIVDAHDPSRIFLAICYTIENSTFEVSAEFNYHPEPNINTPDYFTDVTELESYEIEYSSDDEPGPEEGNTSYEC